MYRSVPSRSPLTVSPGWFGIGEAEIRDPHVAAAVEHEVSRLDVAVEHPVWWASQKRLGRLHPEERDFPEKARVAGRFVPTRLKDPDPGSNRTVLARADGPGEPAGLVVPIVPEAS